MVDGKSQNNLRNAVLLVFVVILLTIPVLLFSSTQNQAAQKWQRGVEQAVIGKLDDSLSTINSAILLAPTIPEYHYSRAKILLLMEKKIEALQSVSQARKILAEEPRFIFLESLLHLQLGKQKIAVAGFKKCLTLNKNLTFHKQIIGVMVDSKLYPQVEEILAKEGNQHSEIWFKMGNQFLTNQPQQALRYYHKAVEITNQNSDYWLNLGICFYRLNELQHSLDALNKALAISASDHRIFYNRSIIYRKLGKIAESRADLQHANQLARKSGMVKE